jgi:hypothetical protein
MNARAKSKFPRLTATARTAATAAVAAFVLTACGLTGGAAPVGNGSSVTAINIGLPDRGALKSQVADIETKMNAYRLVIAPVDATCPDATKLDQIADYASIVVLSASLHQGCDYDVTLALGHQGAGGYLADATLTTYDDQIKSLLDTSCASCHSVSGKQAPFLTSYALAKAKGERILARSDLGTMPLAAALSATDQALVRSWAAGGYLEKAPPAGTTNTTGTTATGATASGDAMTAVYYRNDVAARVKKADIAGVKELKLALALQLQAAGRTIGLGK